MVKPIFEIGDKIIVKDKILQFSDNFLVSNLFVNKIAISTTCINNREPGVLGIIISKIEHTGCYYVYKKELNLSKEELERRVFNRRYLAIYHIDEFYLDNGIKAEKARSCNRCFTSIKPGSDFCYVCGEQCVNAQN